MEMHDLELGDMSPKKSPAAPVEPEGQGFG